MTVSREEALARAHQVVGEVRSRGFRDGAKAFTDRQIWQAVLDCRSTDPHTVAVHLVKQVIDGHSPPESQAKL